jgi:transaldolase
VELRRVVRRDGILKMRMLLLGCPILDGVIHESDYYLSEVKIPVDIVTKMMPTPTQRCDSAAAPSNLRLMLDCADDLLWEAWLPLGLFHGVTTNPLLLESAQVSCQVEVLEVLTQKALAYGVQEVQLQTWGGTVDQYCQTGIRLAAIDPRVVVKIPATKIGVAAAVQLIREGVRVTLTGVYAVPQVLIAAAIGAEYAAPYLGRIHDSGRDGCEELGAMQRSLQGVQSATRLLVASIRRVEDITTLTAQGLNTFTISTAIAAQFFDVPATIQATEAFEAAAQRLSTPTVGALDNGV